MGLLYHFSHIKGKGARKAPPDPDGCLTAAAVRAAAATATTVAAAAIIIAAAATAAVAAAPTAAAAADQNDDDKYPPAAVETIHEKIPPMIEISTYPMPCANNWFPFSRREIPHNTPAAGPY